MKHCTIGCMYVCTVCMYVCSVCVRLYICVCTYMCMCDVRSKFNNKYFDNAIVHIHVTLPRPVRICMYVSDELCDSLMSFHERIYLCRYFIDIVSAYINDVQANRKAAVPDEQSGLGPGQRGRSHDQRWRVGGAIYFVCIYVCLYVCMQLFCSCC